MSDVLRLELVLADLRRKYAEDQPRDDNGRFAGGGGGGDLTGEIKANTVDGAWTALNADRFDLEAQQAAHPENYEPNRGYGTHLKEGATEWRRDVSPDGVPTIYQVIGTDNRTLPPEDRAGAGLPMTAPDGTPVIAARVDGSERPDPYVYRVVSVSEFDQAQVRGYFQSNQSMNLADEGTVASRGSTGTFYAPPNGEDMRIVQFDMHPEDGWKVGSDGYVKTPDPVPFDRARAYSTPLANPRSMKAIKYSPDQPRDDHGRFGEGSGTAQLSDEQKTAVERYTSEGDYVVLNEALRGTDGATVEPWMGSTFKQLDSAIASSTTTRDMTVYRGLDTSGNPDADLPDGWQVGAVVKDPGYISTSSDEKTAYEFTNNSVGGNGWVMKMEVPAGSHALEITGDLNPDIAEFGTQHEWLLPRDSSFEITAKDDNAHTLTVRTR